jgi:hypothetical protein
MVLMSSPCAAALRCFVWMWLSSLPRSKRPASPAAKFQRPADKSRYHGGKALPGSHLARIFQNELFPSLPPTRLNRATLAPPGTRTRSARTPVHRKSEERRGRRCFTYLRMPHRQGHMVSMMEKWQGCGTPILRLHRHEPFALRIASSRTVNLII